MRKKITNIFLIAVVGCIIIGMIDELIFCFTGKSFTWEILTWLMLVLK